MGCFYGKHLFECIKQLSDRAVEKLIKAALEALDLESTDFEICPHCGRSHFVRYGKKQGKQRFFCKDCKRTSKGSKKGHFK